MAGNIVPKLKTNAVSKWESLCLLVSKKAFLLSKQEGSPIK